MDTSFEQFVSSRITLLSGGFWLNTTFCLILVTRVSNPFASTHSPIVAPSLGSTILFREKILYEIHKSSLLIVCIVERLSPFGTLAFAEFPAYSSRCRLRLSGSSILSLLLAIKIGTNLLSIVANR